MGTGAYIHGEEARFLYSSERDVQVIQVFDTGLPLRDDSIWMLFFLVTSNYRQETRLRDFGIKPSR